MSAVDQILTLMAWTVGVIGAGVVLLALFRDRARGRRRCSRCWYDMAATGGLRCPECGRSARRERHMLRTRRHWRYVMLGVFVIGLGVVLAHAPVMRRHGWRAGLPSAVLVYLTPTIEEEAIHIAKVGAGGPMHPVAFELLRRLDDPGFTAREWGVILRRSGALRTRDRWPTDRRLVVQFRSPAWLQGQRDISLHAIEETGPRRELARYRGQITTSYEWSVGKAQAGASGARFRAVIEPTAGATPGAFGATVVVQLPVRAVDHADDAMDPVSAPDILEQVRAALDVVLCVGASDSYGVSVRLDRSKLKLPPRLAVALAVVVERDAGARTVARELSAVGASADATHYCHFDDLPADEVGDPETRKLWTVRIIGAPGGALTDWDKTSFWKGEIEMRLSDLKVINVP